MARGLRWDQDIEQATSVDLNGPGWAQRVRVPNTPHIIMDDCDPWATDPGHSASKKEN